ncbi:MAG: flavodoxin-dependent (E)-4-hydroxy-3-methylbut-2-enyl-diphosphate synthase, partial [Bacilli bacterium]
LYEKPTLISCPSCGRIQYDMFSIINEIEEYLNSLGNIRLKVAIMGCAVNGPGEAMEADIGIAGGSNGAVLIKKGQIMGRIEQADIVSVLKKEIDLFVQSKIK